MLLLLRSVQLLLLRTAVRLIEGVGLLLLLHLLLLSTSQLVLCSGKSLGLSPHHIRCIKLTSQEAVVWLLLLLVHLLIVELIHLHGRLLRVNLLKILRVAESILLLLLWRRV